MKFTKEDIKQAAKLTFGIITVLLAGWVLISTAEIGFHSIFAEPCYSGGNFYMVWAEVMGW